METFIVAFTTFFATIGPLDVAALFTALTANLGSKARQKVAIRGVIIGTIVLLIFALAGEWLLSSLGISLASLKVSGGILLLLIGIDMTFARHSGSTTATEDEVSEAETRHDIAVFPLATPLLAGPGAMGAAILLMANTNGVWVSQAMVLAGLFAVMIMALGLLLLSVQVQKVLGITGLQVITRVMGVLLTALAVEFVFSGLVQSNLFSAL